MCNLTFRGVIVLVENWLGINYPGGNYVRSSYPGENYRGTSELDEL